VAVRLDRDTEIPELEIETLHIDRSAEMYPLYPQVNAPNYRLCGRTVTLADCPSSWDAEQRYRAFRNARMQSSNSLLACRWAINKAHFESKRYSDGQGAPK
jgi:hypothetical protein